jgi:hypothetical protein
MRVWLVLAVLGVGSARAADPAGQSVADAATFGAVAAQASLCGLRDEAWATDLRLAARQPPAGAPADPGQITAALGYGDMEAIEELAADTLAAVCPHLAANPALIRADDAVAAFRRARPTRPVG